MRPVRLLAKSSQNPDEPRELETLPGHTLEAVRVAQILATDFGGSVLESSGLYSDEWKSELKAATVRAAFLHDLGKANSQFQRMLREGPIPRQAFRHELLSLWLPVHFDSLSSWLFESVGDMSRQATLCAVVGHHLQFESGANLTPRDGSGDLSLRLWTDHRDFANSLIAGGECLGVGGKVPTLPPVELNLLDEPLTDVFVWLQGAVKWWRQQRSDVKRFVAIVKALLVAADVASSALPRSGIDSANWVRRVLSRNCTAIDLHKVATAGLDGGSPRKFQQQVAESDTDVTLVAAGCGSGKTVAAYLWAARHASGRKLFFSYPTTGTATQGYKDYVLDEMREDGGVLGTLIHSRSEVDLVDMLVNREEATGLELQLEEFHKWAALSGWDVPVVVCTADTVLGLIQNHRSSLFRFPAIANGAFIFDEVHAYDSSLFQAMLRFLNEFPGAPVLLMTASLPLGRLSSLVSSLGPRLSIVRGPRDLEAAKRYDLEEEGRKEPPWEEVTKTLIHGGKVLWVVNTVDRAMTLAAEAKQKWPESPLEIYHSRFRYIDRVSHHNRVMNAFASPKGCSAFAITTQVCEVSLDISADLLVSDLAPVPSLIQRLGRLNRRVIEGESVSPKSAIIVEPPSPTPYSREELEAARKWLRQVGGRGVSQRDLARVFEEVIDQEPTLYEGGSAWIDGGPFTSLQSLRDPGYTIPVVRAEDHNEYRDVRGRVKLPGVTRCTIPMPLSPVSNHIGRLKRVATAFEAPHGTIEYSAEWGARWQL